MKRSLRFFVLSALLSTVPLCADNFEEEGIYAGENIQDDSPSPFKLEVAGDYVERAKFKTSYLDHQQLQFSEVGSKATMAFYYDACNLEGAVAGIGYTYTHLGWDDNPYFDQEDFNTVNFYLEGFSGRLNNWFWKGQFMLNINAEYFNINQYATYDLLLWGRYNYCDNLGLNIGFLAQTGMKIDRVFPVLGVDWQMKKDWKINLVFPVNISAVYAIDECWSLAAVGRMFDSRQRVGKKANIPRGIFEYRNVGVELALNYACNSYITANVHAGSTLGGSLRIAERHRHHKHRLKLESAGYFGGKVELSF